MIIDLTVRSDNYELIDKVEGITPQHAISLLIIKYNVKWDKKIEAFKMRELEFEQNIKGIGHGRKRKDNLHESGTD
ncbi:MAG TPA: hypothetical protein VMQ58_02015 [Candidatus Saccharimonadales bacterium]|nr:hypothetical protein [Candidatus Saccharimonadales bacterium]